MAGALQTPNVQDRRNAYNAEKARRDPAFFINQFCKTYDPRRQPALIPFKLFARQEQFIRWLQARFDGHEDGLVEKTRDMGVTWLCVGFAAWLWLYREGAKVGFGSRKELLVDRLGDPDSIFEKLRILLRNLPPYMLPQGFSIDEHAGYLKVINPANGATITGEAGDQIGRGGRNSIYFKDESAFYERPERIEAALSQNTDCKIDVSTPNGTGNPFYRKRHSGKLPVFTFHWRDDPRKGEAWYAKQKSQLDPIIVAQEIDIDYTASLEDIVIPGAWVQAAIGFAAPRGKQGVAALDVGGGRDKSVFLCRFGPVVENVNSWGDGDTTATAQRALLLLNASGASQFYFDSVGIGAGVASTLKHANAPAIGINVGEPASQNVWPDGRTSEEKFANLKAEIWWKLRDRFRKTHENVQHTGAHKLEDCISLPPEATELAQQLSLARYLITSTGKLAIESKDSLRRRGVKSPDFADALALTLANEGGDAWQALRDNLAGLNW